MGDVQRYVPISTYFGVEEEVLKCAGELPAFLNSAIFRRLWKEQSKSIQNERQKERNPGCFSFEEVVDNIWMPVQAKFMGMCQQLKNGNITFDRIKRYFVAYKDNYAKLREEFMVMSTAAKMDTKWVERRIYQVEQYYCLHQYRSGAEVMVQLKEAFNLEGNFGKLDILLSAVSLFLEYLFAQMPVLYFKK